MDNIKKEIDALGDKFNDLIVQMDALNLEIVDSMATLSFT